MDIYVIRHGKAEEHLSNFNSDSERKLTLSGRNEIKEIMSGIKNFGISFDNLICSPLVRAVETAKIAKKYLKIKDGEITIWEELLPESSALEIQKKIMTLNPETKVLLVGHEPILSSLISSIISNEHINIDLKKGGFVHIEGTVSNSKINGILKSIMTPKQLKLCK